MDETDDTNEKPPPIAWKIQRKGRAWTRDEFPVRADRLMDLKFEISRGKLFWSEGTRRMILGMLLENVGMDAAVRLGNLADWEEAVAAAKREKAGKAPPDH